MYTVIAKIGQEKVALESFESKNALRKGMKRLVAQALTHVSNAKQTIIIEKL